MASDEFRLTINGDSGHQLVERKGTLSVTRMYKKLIAMAEV